MEVYGEGKVQTPGLEGLGFRLRKNVSIWVGGRAESGLRGRLLAKEQGLRLGCCNMLATCQGVFGFRFEGVFFCLCEIQSNLRRPVFDSDRHDVLHGYAACIRNLGRCIFPSIFTQGLKV